MKLMNGEQILGFKKYNYLGGINDEGGRDNTLQIK